MASGWWLVAGGWWGWWLGGEIAEPESITNACKDRYRPQAGSSIDQRRRLILLHSLQDLCSIQASDFPRATATATSH